MWFIIFIAFLILLGVLISAIQNAIEKRKRRIRNEVAHEIFDKTNIENDIEKYKNRLKHVNQTNEKDDGVDSWEWAELRSELGAFIDFLGRCPECKKGYLCVMKGKYGKFLGCSEYPRCRFTKNIKVAKSEYKELITKQIIGDIKKAYS